MEIYIFGCNPSIFQVGLSKYIDIYYKKYPGIKIHIVSKPGVDLIKMLENRELDMVVRKFGEEVSYHKFSVKIAAQMDHCFFGNKKYEELSKKRHVSIEELSKYPLMLLNQTSYERRSLDSDFKKHNIKLEPIVDFTYHAPIVFLAKQGYGIGYTLEGSIQKELKNKELFKINVDDISSLSNLGIIYNEKYLSATASKFLSLIE